MGILALKWVAMSLSWTSALVGCLAVKKVSGLSVKWMQLCNAIAGGVLISVALVHMLRESAGKLQDWDASISQALGGRASGGHQLRVFPLGDVLAGVGFFLIVGLENLLEGHSHHELRVEGNCPRDSLRDQERLEDSCASCGARHLAEMSNASLTPFAGLSTLCGVSLHSVFEGAAAGATASEETVFLLTGASLCHKGFAAFAVGSSLLAFNDGWRWWTLVLLFSLMSPAGILLGMLMSESLQRHDQYIAALECIAAGTLLAVGITDMLLPALQDESKWRKRKLVASICCYTLVSMLVVWV